MSKIINLEIFFLMIHSLVLPMTTEDEIEKASNIADLSEKICAFKYLDQVFDFLVAIEKSEQEEGRENEVKKDEKLKKLLKIRDKLKSYLVLEGDEILFKLYTIGLRVESKIQSLEGEYSKKNMKKEDSLLLTNIFLEHHKGKSTKDSSKIASTFEELVNDLQ